jgi:hypothetical protein
MSLTQEDLAALSALMDQKIHAAESRGPAPAEPVNRESQVGKAEVPFDAGPLYYLHLANGAVLTSHDSSSTHMPGDDGSTQPIIGRFQVPLDALNDDGTLKSDGPALTAGEAQ